MKKVLYLRKSSSTLDNMTDPTSFVGKQFIFDTYYLIKVLSFSEDQYIVQMDMGNYNQIDKISIMDFLNHIHNGNMIEKTEDEKFVFSNFDEYYEQAEIFLLRNYNVSIESLVFDWENEFLSLTPIEIACKMALRIIRK